MCIVACVAEAVEVAGVHIAVHKAMQAQYTGTYLIIFYFSVTLETPGVTASCVSSALFGKPRSADGGNRLMAYRQWNLH